MPTLKQVQLGSTTYDLDAKYLDGHQWSEIQTINFNVCWTKEMYESPSISEHPEWVTNVPYGITVYYNNGANSAIGALSSGGPTTIYLIYSPNETTDDKYDEYIYTSGTWEKIGSTTSPDLSNYVTKGQYTTDQNASPTSTGSGGSGTATGSATVTYLKPSANTGNDGSHSHSLSFTTSTITYVTGASVVPMTQHDGHTHPITIEFNETTLSYAIDGTLSDSTTHTHDVVTHNHGTNLTIYAPSSSPSGDFVCNARVSNNVLIFDTVGSTFYLAAGIPSQATITSLASGTHTHTFNPTMGSTTMITDVKTASVGMGGTHLHDLHLTTGTFDLPTSGTATSANSSHTHSIDTVQESTIGTVSVAVGNHTHTIAKHTHAISLN